MATIALYANKINQMPGLIKDVKQSVTDYKSELSALKTRTLTINKSVCNLDDVISSIQTSTQTQEKKIASLDTFNQNSENFISDVVRIDSNVADVVRQRKDDFYNQYNYLKPECEKSGWEKFCDELASVGEWCKEHWKLIVTVVLVVVAIVVIVCTAGTTAGPMLILIGACKGLITGAIIGGVMGGLSSMADGSSFWEGFENGAFSGALTGALFGGIGGAFQALGSSCQFLSKIGLVGKTFDKTLKVVSTIAKVSGGLSLGMFGFDFLAMGAGAIWGKDNPFTAFNAKLHESTLYNTFQITTGLVALGTGSFAKGMKTAVCFVAGTMILTAAGVVAIENIKAGNKVISTNEDTWETGEKTVLRTFINESNELAHVFVNGEEIIATPSHLFYVVDKGWIPVASLSQGSVLILPDASRTEVERVTLETLEKPVKVYNFEVADWHTYHVGDSGVLVHNDCIDNKIDGLRREAEVEAELSKEYPESEGYQIKKEALLRDSSGKKVIDPETGTGRRIDFVVDGNGKIVDSIEVTSQTAPKVLQVAKELRIRANGGNYVKFGNGSLLEIPDDIITRIVRRD